MKIIGHRGAKGLAPENTVASFEKALLHGVSEIECDVRVTADNIPVMIHNAWLRDESGNRLKIRDHAYKELLTHKADLATLNEAIQSVDRRVPLLLEIKHGQPTTQIITIIKRCLADGWQPEDLSISSKDFGLLRKLHAALPMLPTVVIERWSGVRATHRARVLGTKRLSMNQLWLWSGFIHGIARGGYQLSAYPMNSPSKTQRWQKSGLYGVITDYPDRFEP